MAGFWLYMFLTALLIPAVMLGFGVLFSKRAPKKINDLFGYRTGRSMKNRETWEFAHRVLGRIWIYAGAVLLPLSVAAMFVVFGRDSDTVGLWSSILVSVQTVALVLSVIPVERGLKKTFDENGQRKH